MLYVGLVAGVAAGNLAAHAAGIDAFRVFVATLILIVPALIGARLFYVVTHWQLYRRNPNRIWTRGEGGAAQYGGLALVLPFSVPLLRVLQLPLGAYWDVAIFTILVAMILGRVGCLMNGCCAGRVSRTWIGVYLPNHAGVWESRIPTQLLEAGWAGVLLLAAIALWRWLPYSGSLFLLVTAGYGCGRVLLESTREPISPARRLTIHHGISIAMIVLSLTTLAAHWPK